MRAALRVYAVSGLFALGILDEERGSEGELSINHIIKMTKLLRTLFADAYKVSKLLK